MNNLNQENHAGPRPFSPIGLFRAWINRRVVPEKGGPIQKVQPVLAEVSPAKVNPFPEPNTMPGGWDLSELTKS